jgi:hypothetical protein
MRVCVYCGSNAGTSPSFGEAAQQLGSALAHRGIGLVYGGITYTKTTHDAKVGPLELSIKDKETVHIPVWAGVGAIVVGGALLLLRKEQ